jgi:hypothetical protein
VLLVHIALSFYTEKQFSAKQMQVPQVCDSLEAALPAILLLRHPFLKGCLSSLVNSEECPFYLDYKCSSKTDGFHCRNDADTTHFCPLFNLCEKDLRTLEILCPRNHNLWSALYENKSEKNK